MFYFLKNVVIQEFRDDKKRYFMSKTNKFINVVLKF